MGLVNHVVCLFTSKQLSQYQINNFPKITMQRYPAETQTHNILVVNPMVFQVSNDATHVSNI